MSPDSFFEASCSIPYFFPGLAVRARRNQPIGDSPVGIAERDEPKLSRRIYNQILRYSAQVRHRQACPHHKLDDKVPIAYAIEAVLGDGIKSELLCEKFSVHGKGVPGKGS